VRDKLKYLSNLYKHQALALKEIDKSFDSQARINAKMMIGDHIISEIMKTVDTSTSSGSALHQECQSFTKDKKNKAKALQSICLQCFCLCPEREVQELPTDYYVEAAQQMLIDYSSELHPLRESKIIERS